MRIPQGYDVSEARESGFREPKAGPCVLIIERMIVEIKNGEQRAIFYLDIADGEFSGHFKKLSEKFDKNRLLRYYQNTEGKGTPYFKGIMKAIENENSFTFDWDESKLHGKRVGGNLREEEYMNRDGGIATALRVAYLCSIRSVMNGEHKVLPVKKLRLEAEEPEYNYDQRRPDEDELPHSDNDLPF